jgi:hypothetical protein
VRLHAAPPVGPIVVRLSGLCESGFRLSSAHLFGVRALTGQSIGTGEMAASLPVDVRGARPSPRIVRPHVLTTNMNYFATTLGLSLAAVSAGAAEPPCAQDASEQAKKLLIFHIGDGFDDRMSFEAPTPKATMKNPANSKQLFNVLEVEGFVRPHGRYRMRLIYYSLPSGCLLMGQEILELADL